MSRCGCRCRGRRGRSRESSLAFCQPLFKTLHNCHRKKMDMRKNASCARALTHSLAHPPQRTLIHTYTRTHPHPTQPATYNCVKFVCLPLPSLQTTVSLIDTDPCRRTVRTWGNSATALGQHLHGPAVDEWDKGKKPKRQGTTNNNTKKIHTKCKANSYIKFSGEGITSVGRTRDFSDSALCT